MSLLIETIRLENGVFGNLDYHQHRLDRSRMALFSDYDKIDLQAVLARDVSPKDGLYKCRVTYDSAIHIIQYEPYTIRSVTSLKKVELNELSYSYKYADRGELKQAFERRGENDDILIIKNGLVSDTSYANIVFKNNDDQWVTPSPCLLKGTMRQYMLEKRQIKEQQISVNDIPSFKKYKLINSMLRWDGPERDVSNIV